MHDCINYWNVPLVKYFNKWNKFAVNSKSVTVFTYLFVTGIIGDWKNTFTEAQNEEFEALYKEEMEGFQGEVVYEPRW